MKAHGQLKVLSRVEPTILISHYDLEQIRHVVRIAPQEAQWFHQINRIQKDGSDKVTYHIYNMIIPEQECSAAQVETDPMQMMKMYKAVKANVEATMGEEPDMTEVTNKVNEIMSSIGCWSHSHVNMGVTPSGTDNNTFKERIVQASQIDSTEPQIMLIFNKRDDFFCRLYDPAVDGGVLFENVPIQVGTYDFASVSAECKLKMKERKFVAKKGQVMHRGHAVSNLTDPRRYWQGHGSRPTSTTGVDSPRGQKPSSGNGGNGHTVQGLFLKTSYPWEKSLEKALEAANESNDSAAVEPVLEQLTQILSLSQLRILDLLTTGNGSTDIEEVFNWDWKKEEKAEAKDAEGLLATAYENIGAMLEVETPEWDFLKYGCFMALALRNLKQDKARRTVLTMWDDFATSQLLFDSAFDGLDDSGEWPTATSMPGVGSGTDVPGVRGNDYDDDDDLDDWDEEYKYYKRSTPSSYLDDNYSPYTGTG